MLETQSNAKHSALSFSIQNDGRTTMNDPVTTETYGELMDEFIQADQLGYVGIWISEHHGFKNGYMPAPFTFAASIATLTEHVRIGTNVLLLPLWPIRLVAEETAVVDVLSGGRFRLGVGLGFIPHEFAAFGVALRQRRRLMEDGIPYLRTAFRGEDIPDGPDGELIPITPRPAQGEHLPIYMGAKSDVAIERVARLADGFLASGFPTTDLEGDLRENWGVLRTNLEKNGRDLTSFPIVLCMHMWVSDDPERDWETMLAPAAAYQQNVYMQENVLPGQQHPPTVDPKSLDRKQFLVDTPGNVIKRIESLQSQIPISEICFWSHPPGVPHKAASENLERIARQVMVEFR